MTHPLDDRIAIDVDQDHTKGWPGGLAKLKQVRIGDRPISVLFFDPHEKKPDGTYWVTSKTLDDAAALGFVPGMRYVSHWDDGADPDQAALIGSTHISRLEADGKRRVQVVEWDVEQQQGGHDVDWQTKLLIGWTTPGGARVRGLRGCGGFYPDPKDPSSLGYRWGRPFVFTMEGRQNKTSSAALVAARAGGKVGPQCYNGAYDNVPDMDEMWDPWWEIRTWVLGENGNDGEKIPLTSFIPYYDARKAKRLSGVSETVLFATSRLTELYS